MLFSQHDDVISVVIVLEVLCSNNRQLPALARSSSKAMQLDRRINRLFSHTAVRRPFPAQNADEPTFHIGNNHVIAR